MEKGDIHDFRHDFRPNQSLHLSGAANLVLRGMKVMQAAPAGELGR